MVNSFHFAGFRQFQANIANATATLRSRTSIKSEDDLPPPYEAQIESPPPYHVAISSMTNSENPDQITTLDETDTVMKK